MPRAVQILARRGPVDALRVTRREASYLASAQRLSFALGRAARTKRPILVGPFLGEVGFELLYWLPVVRAALERHRIARERVTVVTRGGAAAWYGDVAAHAVELFDLVSPSDLRAQLAERRRAVGDQKQLTVESIDRELAARASRDLHDPFVLHPQLMYAGLRMLHAGWRSLRQLRRVARFAPLPPASVALPELPGEFAALRLYENDCFSSAAAWERAGALVRDLATRLPVVALVPPGDVDDHAVRVPGVAGIQIVTLREPSSNLAVQTEIVRRARALLTVAGGFSYLGPFVGTPTLALHETLTLNPVHLDVLRRAVPEARYLSADLDHAPSPDVLETFLR